MDQATILIVDDNPTNLRVLVDSLNASGFKTLVAANGEWAIQQVERIQPDLILLDVLMPGIDGFEICRQLKKREGSKDIPVIFMTALTDTIDKMKGFEVGGVDYLTKPVQHKEVLARLNTHLTTRWLQQQLKQQNEQLRQEVSERKRAEDALRQQSDQLAMLNQMSDTLQACQTDQQMYNEVMDTCKQLFPSDSGYLCMLNKSNGILEMVASWGNSSPKTLVFSRDDCWALRRGEMYVVERPEPNLVCSHLHSFPANGYLCAPIHPSGEILGMLHLCCDQEKTEDSDDECAYRLESKQMVISKVTKHFALSLLNLRLREALRLEAIHDPLTGLYNRRYMEESLEQEASRAKRRHAPVGIIMLDIDHFKRFNDDHGHEAGDSVLQILGTFLLRHIRHGDIACRYGGEEFLLIMPDSTLEFTQRRAEELCAEVRNLPIPYQGKTMKITISLGVAALPNYGSRIREAVNSADAAMYQAKSRGRDQVAIAS